jgi:hypothetical protein
MMYVHSVREHVWYCTQCAGLFPTAVYKHVGRVPSQWNFVTNEFREIEAKRITLLRKIKWSFRRILCYAESPMSCYERE